MFPNLSYTLRMFLSTSSTLKAIPPTFYISKVKSLSRARLWDPMDSSLHQAPRSMRFSRQEYWSGLPFPSPGNLPNPGIKRGLLHCRQILYHLSHQGSPFEGRIVSISGVIQCTRLICMRTKWVVCSALSTGMWLGSNFAVPGRVVGTPTWACSLCQTLW